MRKRFGMISCFVLALLFLFSFPTASYAGLATAQFKEEYQAYLQKNGLTQTGNGAIDIVNCARAMLGKTGADVNAEGQWCASFVSACAKAVGQGGAVPWKTNVSAIYNSCKDKGGTVIYNRDTGTGNFNNALPGDIVGYATSSSTWGHVEIVSRKISSGKIKSIGGNTGSGSDYKTRKVVEHEWATSKITYVIRPNYANATPITVTFDLNDDRGICLAETITVTTGSTYGTLPSPSRDGYNFLGWYDAANGGNAVTSSTTVTKTSNHVLYAHWSLIIVTVYFDGNGGFCGYTDRTVAYGGTYHDLPTPTWAGHDFTGWYTASSGGLPVYNSTTVTTAANHTLYAHWTNSSYTVYFDANGGSCDLDDSKTVTFGETYGDLPTPTWTGYDFDGWYTAPSDGSRIYSDTTVTTAADHTLYAHWTVPISGQCGDNLYWSFDASTGALTITGSGAMYDFGWDGSLNLPRTPWVASHDEITSVSLPEGITSIGSEAFDRCHNLSYINFPGSLTSIGHYAFEECYCFAWFRFPSSLVEINKYAFLNCTNLNSITIRSSEITICEGAFADCTSLTDVYYEGTEAQKAQMYIDEDSNDYLLNTTWHYLPEIITQPENVTVNEGKTATFQVVATGADSYQWQYQKPGESTWNDVIKNGASATYSLTAAARHNGYTYRCQVISAMGSTYSDTVTLTVNTKPVITTQPTSVSVNEGKTAAFKVVATSADSYKWQYQKPGESTWNDVTKNGTSASYSLTTAARHNGYTYRCKVTNAAGSVYTNAVTLTVKTKPVITTQPINATVNEGKTATFKVVATGATGYKWQYQKPGESTWNDVTKNGTSATYSLTTAARHNGYKYRCKVTNAAGTVISNVATLTVTTASKPTITTQPKSATVYVGKTATFKVVATGATSYQWQYQKPGESTWTNVSKNGTSASYSLTTAARHNGYMYRCKVTNAAGSVYTSTVTLTVSEKPVITTQPKDASVTAGTKATFKVVADGATKYQWQYKKPGDTTWTNVSKNGTSASYSLTTAARHNGYKYRCKVTNSVGSTYSSTVTLTVK